MEQETGGLPRQCGIEWCRYAFVTCLFPFLRGGSILAYDDIDCRLSASTRCQELHMCNTQTGQGVSSVPVCRMGCMVWTATTVRRCRRNKHLLFARVARQCNLDNEIEPCAHRRQLALRQQHGKRETRWDARRKSCRLGARDSIERYSDAYATCYLLIHG